MSTESEAKLFSPRNHVTRGSFSADGVLYPVVPADGLADQVRKNIYRIDCLGGQRQGPLTHYFGNVSVNALMTKATICPIFWGSQWQTQAGGVRPDQVMNAIANIVSSPYLSFVSQYAPATIDTQWFWQEDPALQFDIGLLPAVVIDSPASALQALSEESSDFDSNGHHRSLSAEPPPNVSQADVWLLIRIVMNQLLQTKKIRNPVDLAEEVFYVIFTPFGATNDGGTGGYHHWKTVSTYSSVFADSWRSALVPFSVVGAIRYPIAQMLDDVTEAFSHELVETVSDPFGSGVRLLPSVQAAKGIKDNGNEIGDYAQAFDPAPFRRVSSGESLSAYWSDWHGTGVVPERYPYRDEFSGGKGCPDHGKVRQYLNQIEKYIDAHGGDPSPVLNGLRRHDLSVAGAIGVAIKGRQQWNEVAMAAAQMARKLTQESAPR